MGNFRGDVGIFAAKGEKKERAPRNGGVFARDDRYKLDQVIAEYTLTQEQVLFFFSSARPSGFVRLRHCHWQPFFSNFKRLLQKAARPLASFLACAGNECEIVEKVRCQGENALEMYIVFVLLQLGVLFFS